MTTIIERYIAKRVLFASLIASAACLGPVILTSLFTQLPREAIFTSLVWPALTSIAPMIAYNALPLVVSAAVVWEYGNFSAEGTMTVLYAAGISPQSIRRVILSAASAITVLCYFLSVFFAPWGAGHLHDVLFSLRHELYPGFLKPSQFNKFGDGREVFFFETLTGDGKFTNVFFREFPTPSTERSYVAKWASFLGQGADTNLVLLDGSMQVFDQDKADTKFIYFNTMSIPLSALRGSGNLSRSYRIVDELDIISFVKAAGNAFGEPEAARKWVREAVKRFAVPLLLMIHTVLGLELLAVWSPMGRTQRHPIILICAVLAALHIAAVAAADQIGLQLAAAWGFATLAGTELVAAAGLALIRLGRAGTAGRRRPRLRASPVPAQE